MVLLEGMRQKGMKPDVITYNAAISTCGKAKQLGKALKLREVRYPNCMKPDGITYNAAIGAYNKAAGRGLCNNQLFRGSPVGLPTFL